MSLSVALASFPFVDTFNSKQKTFINPVERFLFHVKGFYLIFCFLLKANKRLSLILLKVSCLLLKVSSFLSTGSTAFVNAVESFSECFLILLKISSFLALILGTVDEPVIDPVINPFKSPQ